MPSATVSNYFRWIVIGQTTYTPRKIQESEFCSYPYHCHGKSCLTGKSAVQFRCALHWSNLIPRVPYVLLENGKCLITFGLVAWSSHATISSHVPPFLYQKVSWRLSCSFPHSSFNSWCAGVYIAFLAMQVADLVLVQIRNLWQNYAFWSTIKSFLKTIALRGTKQE